MLLRRGVCWARPQQCWIARIIDAFGRKRFCRVRPKDHSDTWSMDSRDRWNNAEVEGMLRNSSVHAGRWYVDHGKTVHAGRCGDSLGAHGNSNKQGEYWFRLMFRGIRMYGRRSVLLIFQIWAANPFHSSTIGYGMKQLNFHQAWPSKKGIPDIKNHPFLTCCLGENHKDLARLYLIDAKI